MQFQLPPIIHDEKGEIRKVGYELEFADVDITGAVSAIVELYHGEEKRVNNFFSKIVNTDIGDFTVKIDTRILVNESYKKFFDLFDVDINEMSISDIRLQSRVEELLESLASYVVPYEIVTPPVEIDKMDVFEDLRRKLYHLNAKGTKYSFNYAFATHINPSLPNKKLNTIINYLRAFFLLYPWLLKISRIDFARQLTPFINHFPATYIRKVLSKNYNPGVRQFIRDYHEYNTDRNRPLDLYPLLSILLPEEVGKLEGIGNVKSRETFHYRLPNSLVDDPTWTLAQEWNNWNMVEYLAFYPTDIEKLSEEYLDMDHSMLFGMQDKWKKRMDIWMEDKGIINQK